MHTHRFVPADGKVVEDSFAIPQILILAEKFEDYFKQFEHKETEQTEELQKQE